MEGGFTCVAFGDQPASVLLELTKEVAADKGKEVDEMTAVKLVRDSYVDDNLSGGSKEEVAQMRGTMEKLPNGKLK